MNNKIEREMMSVNVLINILEMKEIEVSKELSKMDEETLLGCFEQLAWLKKASGKYTELIKLVKNEIKRRG